MPSEDWIYEKEGDRVRYVLGKKGMPSLICFGINPSTAMPDKLDSTLRVVAGQADHKGFSGWIMLNLYPQRATQPRKIHRRINKKIHQENMDHIENVLRTYEGTVWAAWGTLVETRPFLSQCLREVGEIATSLNISWVERGACSKAGHPHHPLYVEKSKPFKEFDFSTYLDRLKT